MNGLHRLSHDHERDRARGHDRVHGYEPDRRRDRVNRSAFDQSILLYALAAPQGSIFELSMEAVSGQFDTSACDFVDGVGCGCEHRLKLPIRTGAYAGAWMQGIQRSGPEC